MTSTRATSSCSSFFLSVIFSGFPPSSLARPCRKERLVVAASDGERNASLTKAPCWQQAASSRNARTRWNVKKRKRGWMWENNDGQNKESCWWLKRTRRFFLNLTSFARSLFSMLASKKLTPPPPCFNKYNAAAPSSLVIPINPFQASALLPPPLSPSPLCRRPSSCATGEL